MRGVHAIEVQARLFQKSIDDESYELSVSLYLTPRNRDEILYFFKVAILKCFVKYFTPSATPDWSYGGNNYKPIGPTVDMKVFYENVMYNIEKSVKNARLFTPKQRCAFMLKLNKALHHQYKIYFEEVNGSGELMCFGKLLIPKKQDFDFKDLFIDSAQTLMEFL